MLGAWKLSHRAVAVALVGEGVDDVRGNEHEGPGRRTYRLDVRAHAEPELALDDEERVDVPVVDVRVGTALAGLVPRPRHVDQRVLGERAHRARGPVRHRRAVVGGEESRMGRVRLHAHLEDVHADPELRSVAGDRTTQARSSTGSSFRRTARAR